MLQAYTETSTYFANVFTKMKGHGKLGQHEQELLDLYMIVIITTLLLLLLLSCLLLILLVIIIIGIIIIIIISSSRNTCNYNYDYNHYYHYYHYHYYYRRCSTCTTASCWSGSPRREKTA